MTDSPVAAHNSEVAVGQDFWLKFLVKMVDPIRGMTINVGLFSIPMCDNLIRYHAF